MSFDKYDNIDNYSSKIRGYEDRFSNAIREVSSSWNNYMSSIDDTNSDINKTWNEFSDKWGELMAPIKNIQDDISNNLIPSVDYSFDKITEKNDEIHEIKKSVDKNIKQYKLAQGTTLTSLQMQEDEEIRYKESYSEMIGFIFGILAIFYFIVNDDGISQQTAAVGAAVVATSSTGATTASTLVKNTGSSLVDTIVTGLKNTVGELKKLSPEEQEKEKKKQEEAASTIKKMMDRHKLDINRKRLADKAKARKKFSEEKKQIQEKLDKMSNEKPLEIQGGGGRYNKFLLLIPAVLFALFFNAMYYIYDIGAKWNRELTPDEDEEYHFPNVEWKVNLNTIDDNIGNVSFKIVPSFLAFITPTFISNYAKQIFSYSK